MERMAILNFRVFFDLVIAVVKLLHIIINYYTYCDIDNIKFSSVQSLNIKHSPFCSQMINCCQISIFSMKSNISFQFYRKIVGIFSSKFQSELNTKKNIHQYQFRLFVL